ncbi:MAG: YeeE/YedE family protein [Saprospiraceae bacterium]|nr:YeeE/YedE family protein [Saprospiraceae bacterium]MBK8510705.1 YeeE/YedE family protein [Saprospiraceae bacterium]MBK9677665.1 YeeE/YedE family protein [Saprospiraceae bacterium]MBK9932488.1 YeeE/YedE family protein [Saprospiraceae bacterium]MBL0110122.1 YeeE/YedE family protein [Saprospiraceae bacterium]
MKMSRYILVGILLGITLYKTEAVSWFRIFEMFHFQSFHMYGIIMSAIAVGIVMVQIIKRKHLRSIEGKEIVINPKDTSWKRYIIGGFIFGLGWALAGVCPGPMFILLGSGYTVLIVFLLAAMSGTFAYGYFRKRLPH